MFELAHHYGRVRIEEVLDPLSSTREGDCSEEQADQNQVGEGGSEIDNLCERECVCVHVVCVCVVHV